MEILTFIFEIMGTAAFSVSGAIVAIDKKMDVFGVMILGLTTAVGGGIFRDLILGNTPPQAFKKPIYPVVALITALIVFVIAASKKISVRKPLYDTILLLMDSVGLGIFTVVGISVARQCVSDGGFFLQLFVGVVTGVGGGVLRDMMAGDKPFIFVKHFYATASVIGAAVCYGLWLFAGEVAAISIGTAVVIILRLLAAYYRWELPKA